MLQFLAKVEIINAAAAVSMTIGLLVACLLLSASLTELTELKRQMTMRNQQGAVAVHRLEEIAAKLEQFEPRRP